MTTTIEYALMAGASYISTRGEVNRFPTPQGWIEQIEGRGRIDSSGFEATHFTKGTEIVISFAGTYPTDFSGDQATNVGLGLGLGSPQIIQAAAYYLQVCKDYPNATITLTGHSLGGGLAALVGVFFGVTTKTFDQAPFANSAQGPSILYPGDTAAYLRSELAAMVDANGSRLYSDTALIGLTNFLQLRADYGGIPRSSLVTDINVQGEFLSAVNQWGQTPLIICFRRD